MSYLNKPKLKFLLQKLKDFLNEKFSKINSSIEEIEGNVSKKVDNDQYANSQKAGLVQTSAANGLYTDDNGILYTAKASVDDIQTGTNEYKVIVPSNISSVMKEYGINDKTHIEGIENDLSNIETNLDAKLEENNFNTEDFSFNNDIVSIKNKVVIDDADAARGKVWSSQKVQDELSEIKLYKTPNAIIYGEPNINNGQISGFSSANYLSLPFALEFTGKTFELTMAFTTGNDVTTAQNIFGSAYSMAAFIQNGKLTIRISSNGTSWNILDYQCSFDILANRTYYIKIAFSGINYKISYSTDGKNYNLDKSQGTNQYPFNGIIHIGIGNNNNNPFLGIIDFNKCEIKVSGMIFWEGMDDAGLATRLATDLENIDQEGIEKIKEFALEGIDLSDKEDIENKITSLSELSTDTQYPSAKAVYTSLENKVDKTEIKDMVLSEEAIDFGDITEPEYIAIQDEIKELTNSVEENEKMIEHLSSGDDTEEEYKFTHSEIITKTGGISANTGYSRTDFIDLKNAKSIIAKVAHNEYIANVGWFDYNKKFISMQEAPPDSSTFTINSDAYPNGARFVVFCTSNTLITSAVKVARSHYMRENTHLSSGFYQYDGRFIQNNDFSHARFKTKIGEKWHVIGCTYGGSNALVTCWKDGIFKKYLYVGSGGTTVYRNVYFDVEDADEIVISISNICIDNGLLRVEKYAPYSNGDEKLQNKKIATMGDSITADDYCGNGTIISHILNAYRVGNFAVGGATCSDAINGSEIDLVHTNVTEIGDSDVNVLSNQVRRLLARTTKSGQQIKWTHPTDGEFSIPVSFGTGIGIEEDVPDIIYIAISTNDGGVRTGEVVDDTDIVIGQTYSQLTRKSISSGLRWAIETLRSAYPNATIMCATPLWSGSQYSYASYATTKLKGEIIKKICSFCSVLIIDSQTESGFTKLVADSGSDSAKIHPDKIWRYNISKYVANQIEHRYTKIGTTASNGIID